MNAAQISAPLAQSLASLAERPLALMAPAALALMQGAYGVSATPKSYVLRDSVAVLGARGVFSNRRGEWFAHGSYEELRATLDAALADPQCSAIVLDVDSPGGDAAGAMETSAYIRRASARKPIVAFVDGIACSAAYALACGAPDLIVAPSATIGSIGIVTLHWDISQMLAGHGLKPTLLHSGAYKTDGSPLKPLDKGAAVRLQNMLGTHYEHFLTTVGAHRAALGASGARKTEAGVFVGADAVRGALVDRLGSMSDAIALARSRAGRSAPTPFVLSARSAPQAPSSIKLESNVTNEQSRAAKSHAEAEAAREAFASAFGPMSPETKKGLLMTAQAYGKVPRLPETSESNDSVSYERERAPASSAEYQLGAETMARALGKRP